MLILLDLRVLRLSHVNVSKISLTHDIPSSGATGGVGRAGA